MLKQRKLQLKNQLRERDQELEQHYRSKARLEEEFQQKITELNETRDEVNRMNCICTTLEQKL